MMARNFLTGPALVVVVLAGVAFGDDGRIGPYSGNTFYWQYQGKPVVLLGGTWQHNLFNHPEGLVEHLDLLRSVGGNYARNTMSFRERGNVLAYERGEDGLYDLERWNDEYWERFDRFLTLTRERDIIVQIEVWETWDHFGVRDSLAGWVNHPFNPANNRNYSVEESGLPTEINYNPGPEPSEHAFYHTVPALHNNAVVLPYQERFVEKILESSLPHPHVLYCLNNESGERIEWSDYWADFIHEKAEARGIKVYMAEMRRNEDLRAPDHKHVFGLPQRYTFLDISQNTTHSGQTHWDRMMFVRNEIASAPRPINSVKLYSIRGSEEEPIARFIRIVFAGCAAVRFHRPHPAAGPEHHVAESGWGLGLSPRAQRVIQSMRMLTDEMRITACEPRNDLLSGREPNEAYVLAEPGSQYAVYFPDGGSAGIEMEPGAYTSRWLDVMNGRWTLTEAAEGGTILKIAPPASGHWILLLKKD